MINRKAVLTVEKAVFDRGIDILIRELGQPDALKFILAIERGSGNSVKEFKELWGDKSVREIHQKILAAKAKGMI